MRQHNSCPATSATVQMGAMMTVMASGAMHAVEGMRRVAAERCESSVFQGYADALQRAQAYAYKVAAVAEAAVAKVNALEAENARLRAACRQRQQVIDSFRGAA